MLFSINELIDLVIMVVAVGFIFSKIFKKEQIAYDPLEQLRKKSVWFDDLWYGIIIAAPAIVLHELAHKFVAMGFGATATLQAPVILYLIAIAMVLSKFPIIFLVGGYVSIIGQLSPVQLALVSVAGPLTNCAIWGVSRIIVKNNVMKKYTREIVLVGKLNFFLFVFNMIPIPMFDGFGFFYNILRVIFGF